MTVSPLKRCKVLGPVPIDPDHEFGPLPIVALVVPCRHRFRVLWRGFDDDLLKGGGCLSATASAADHEFVLGPAGRATRLAVQSGTYRRTCTCLGPQVVSQRPEKVCRLLFIRVSPHERGTRGRLLSRP